MKFFRYVMMLFAAICVNVSLNAREITSLTIEDNLVVVQFDAGESGSGHVLYYVWSNDGVDKGEDISAWPNIVRLGRVADDATEYSFSLPDKAMLTGLYSARVFFATSEKKYDNFVDGVTSAANAYVNTGVMPQGGKTSITVDFKFASATSQYYIFGTWIKSAFSFCAYINTSTKWAYACKKSDSPWTETSLAASAKRTVITLDAAKPQYSVSNSDGSISVTPSGVGTSTTTYPIYLFGRNNGGTYDKKAKATIYSCVITTNGVCVRDYRPAVYGGVPGLYDSVNNTFTGSGTSSPLTVTGNTILTYELDAGDVTVAASEPFSIVTSDFTTELPYEEKNSFSFSKNGSKSGSAPLILSGANNFGGTFTVNDGALIADFGQGLALTDNLVFNGGTFGLLTGSVFNWTIGNGGGETKIGEGITEYGFTAYGNPFSIVANSDASTPLEFGAASSTSFNPTKFILNDDWANETVTLKNGIVGTSGDTSIPRLNVYSGAGEAVIEGSVSGINLTKIGAGTLSFRAANNSFEQISPRGGTLLFAPPEGVDKCRLSFCHIYNNTVNGGTVVISNATITQTGSGVNQTWYGGTKVSLIGSTWNSTKGGWYPGNQKGSGANAVFIIDNSTVKISGDYFYPGNGGDGDKNAKCDLILTNNASFSVAGFHGRQGTAKQYDGSVVSINNNEGGIFRLGSSGTSEFNYYLYGGSLIQNNSGNAASFSLGMSSDSTKTKGVGRIYIYDGGEFTAKCAIGYLGRYRADKGYLYIRGGKMTMTKDGADLRIGYDGSGVCEVSDGGTLDMQKGYVLVVPQTPNNIANRTGQVSLFTNSTIKARSIYSNGENSSAILVLDGGKIIANTGSTTNDLVYGLTEASVGIGGVVIDTNSQDKEISQSFASIADQIVPSATTGSELAALAAFTKVGEGTLSLTGANSYQCATCVSNGTLSVVSGALPATTLRLGGGVIDLCGATHEVENLVGSGVVSNGTLVVTGAVWPGVGDSGVLSIDSTASITLSKIGCFISEDGSCGKLEVAGSLDISGVEIVSENMDKKGDKPLTLVKAARLIGSPSMSSVDGVRVSVIDSSLRLGIKGLTIMVR